MTVNDELEQLRLDDRFDYGQCFAVLAQYGALPAFEKKLWELICAADVHQLQSIFLGFPDEVAGYTAWSAGEVKAKLELGGYRL